MKNIQRLLESYRNDQRISTIVQSLNKEAPARLQLEGLAGSAESFVLAGTYLSQPRHNLFIANDKESAAYIQNDCTLARVDRCAGRTYAHLHNQQSNLLESRKRFKRFQRLHTSDGDKAQTLAERVPEKRQGLTHCMRSRLCVRCAKCTGFSTFLRAACVYSPLWQRTD